ncbi:hypothetical protein [Mycolicibacterium litorale]|uniref:Transmembrane protein n=1 Tax=Mycolicibacterium litorale TaxID=758802 RepID=A0AAD1ILU1_9MYCO|nr:hypothetical protein [Mycolicibacterium litorale]MCV7416105.1 hypothetical protein [Mycolicibacterium litorale]TDY09356.1 hypothetical protein BCL50_1447 [Mycolicibacterium litorale]BBY17301.1 hypothetical protein MLIT_28930 [Mycolicibacterium litorale]
MNIVEGAVRLVAEAANATTAAAGAVGGAAVNGIVGGVQGAASGARRGLSSGSHSTPAALLTMGAVGAAGLVEWPVLAAVGGTALLVRGLDRNGDATAEPAQRPSGSPGGPRKGSAARKKTVTGRP